MSKDNGSQGFGNHGRLPGSKTGFSRNSKFDLKGNRIVKKLQCNGVIADGSRCSKDATIAGRCTNRYVHQQYRDDWPDS